MIDAIIVWSTRNRMLVVLCAAALTFFGVRAGLTLPIDAIPDLSENQVIVFTDWPGRSPREIEDQVTYPLSVNLQGLAGVKVLRASSEFNFSMINVIFEDSVDFYFARQRVAERLALAGTFLPEGVTPYLAPDATALGQILWYTVEGEGFDLGELRSIQDWYVRYQLNGVPGVAEVATVGGSPREYQVDLDPNAMRAFGVTLGEVYEAVSRANSAVGGGVLHKGNAEYVVRSVGWIESLDDLRRTVVASRDGVPVTLERVAAVQFGPGFKRGVLEKDGREAVGGVVLMRHGENPREVTRRAREKISALQAGLPEGVRIVPFYDRTPLIDGAIATLERVVVEEVVICSLAILLVLGHLGGAFLVSFTMVLAILASLLAMKLLGVPSNIMSLAGIAISVGMLVDQAVVMTENAAHRLTGTFGRGRARGDLTPIVLPACLEVGRPIFFSVLITILSFLPVFALSGLEGRMFHPLAYTKTFALVAVAVLSVTLVPALIPVLMRGRIKSEEENWLVRTMIGIFRPMLSWMLDRPLLTCWLFALILGFGWLAASRLGREFMPRLNEGTLLDMPTSAPRMSVTQATADLKARNALIRDFPEVSMVVGKAGRAETATDPAPLDMVETVINLRPRAERAARGVRLEDARDWTERARAALVSAGLLEETAGADREDLVEGAASGLAERLGRGLRDLAAANLREFDADAARGVIRGIVDARLGPGFSDPRWTAEVRAEVEGGLNRSFGERFLRGVDRDDVLAAERGLAARMEALGIGIPESGTDGSEEGWRGVLGEAGRLATDAVFGLEGSSRADRLSERLARGREEELAGRVSLLNAGLRARAADRIPVLAAEELGRAAGGWKGGGEDGRPPAGAVEAVRAALGADFGDRVILRRMGQGDLEEELDAALQTPGWGNIFTQPIINRIDMLSTGVRTQIGVKVFGDDLDAIQETATAIAEALRPIPGAADVVPDQIVGKGYVEIRIDHERAARHGVRVGDVQEVVEVALGGKALTTTVDGRRRYPIRARFARDARVDEESVRELPIEARGLESGPEGPAQVPLGLVADVRVVEGPSVIKSENGMLRAYVQLNVRGRDPVGFVEEARRVVAESVELRPGMYVEWAGEYEHQERARRTLRVVFPATLAVILILLYLAHRSWVEPVLVMTSVLGALAGGAMFQWLLGVNFSVAVWVGYIAAFGMAVETGVVMLVYLRQAVEARGGLANIRSEEELREAILRGAVHRLRPKLLTEGTAILALAPMVWADGVGAEMIRPMAAPVLGGLLVADEVIDVFLPVMYFQILKRRLRRRGTSEGTATGAESGEGSESGS